MMERTANKFWSVALAVALSFYMLVPVPTGVNALDRGRYDTAEAVLPAAAVPVVQVFATALAAYGVYVAGTTQSDYSVNLNALYERFGNFYVGDIESVLGTAITDDGFVNLGALGSDVWNSISEWAQGLVNGGDALEQSSSIIQPELGSIKIGNYTYQIMDGIPEIFQQYPQKVNEAAGKGYSTPLIYIVDNSGYSLLHLSNSANPVATFNSDGSAVSVGSWRRVLLKVANGTATTNVLQGPWSNQITGLTYGQMYIYSGCTIQGATTTENYVESDALAGIEPAVLEGTAAIPDATVEPFNPTTEMLETGYSLLDVVTATLPDTNSLLGTIRSILMHVDTTLGGVLGALEPVVVIGEQVGAMNTTLEGVLEGVGELVPGMTSVTAWLETMAGTLDGVLEGIGGLQNPWGGGDFDWTYDGTTAIPGNPSAVGGVVDLLEDKAPFAYMLAVRDAFDGVAGTWSGNPSFSLTLTIPKSLSLTAGEVATESTPLVLDFNAVLNRQIAGNITIAYLIRVLLTFTLVAGLVVFAVKFALAMKGGE